MNEASAPSPRAVSKAVWTGEELLVWAGRSELGEVLEDGAAYDPAADTWRPVAAAGSPPPGRYAAWSGSEMLAWGGVQGGRYDPALDTWTLMTAEGQPSWRRDIYTHWVDQGLLVLGGFVSLGGGYEELVNEVFLYVP